MGRFQRGRRVTLLTERLLTTPSTPGQVPTAHRGLPQGHRARVSRDLGAGL